MTRTILRLTLVVLVSVAAANVLHRVVFPAAAPDPATYPRTGDTFGSVSEGFTQQVVDVRNGGLVLRTRIAPRAPGPPRHLHRSFAETFTVESGTLHLELPNGVLRLAAGQHYTIAAGVPHRPHNPTDGEVVVGTNAPVMPQAFGACLVQIYSFLDSAQGRVGPDLALRIAALDPMCDAHTPGVPAVARFGLEWMVLPFARAMGFENYYPERSLHPQPTTRG